MYKTQGRTFTMNGTNDTELDAEPVDQRCPVARGTRGQIPNNRISNAELYNNNPHYPRNADQNPVEPIDLIHFVFVFAHEDWTKFNEFYTWFKGIVSTLPNGDQVKMEKYDSQVFPPTHDENVHDICERAMFILPFLSQNFCTNNHLRFFLSEGIGSTRLDPTKVSCNVSVIVKNQKKYAIRPVFTADPRCGAYRIPTGLSMIRGIDYFNKEKEYVTDRVVGMINEAMREFNERKDAMHLALTGSERFLDDFDEEFERTHGPPPTSDRYERLGHEYSFPEDNFPIQENGDGACQWNLPNPDISKFVEGITMMEAPQNNLSIEGTGSSPDHGFTARGASTNPSDTTLEEDAARPTMNSGDHGSRVCSSDTGNDVSLEIDNGSLHKEQPNMTTGATAMGQVGQAASGGSAGKDGNRHQGNLMQGVEKTKKKGQKLGETLNIVIKNCNNVQIGENAALLTSKRDQEALRRKYHGNFVISEANSDDPSSSESNSEMTWNNLSSSERDFEDTQTKDLENSDSDNDSGLLPDNIPSNFSSNIRNTTNNNLTGLQINVDDSVENHEDAISDHDSFLDYHLNDTKLDSLPEYKEEQPDAVQQQCVTDVHLRVLNLCKNTRKISNSIDSGYLSHMCISSVHTSCLAQRQGSRHTDDEDVD
ncbi:uncharacterized protein LOC111106952 isoform X3 [Crassostrea virginica]